MVISNPVTKSSVGEGRFGIKTAIHILPNSLDPVPLVVK